MNNKSPLLAGILFFFLSQFGYATPDRIQLAVWVNEATTATYTFNYKNYMEQQREIAKYFTSEGWISYSKALDASKVPDVVKQNHYDVTAVATQPPKLVTLDPTHWQATLNILVVYQNPKYQQRQNLKVVLNFSEAPAGQGVRGLVISTLKSTPTQPPCQCPNPDTTKPNSKSTNPNPATPAVQGTDLKTDKI
jgi:hypothetical protein